MAENNKVIWAEGMFLRHQHFQQQEKYFENYIHDKLDVFSSIGWGFTALAIDQQHLALGRLGLNEASGIFPDGTPFDTNTGAEMNQILELPRNLHNSLVYLALPLQGANLSGPTGHLNADVLAREQLVEQTVKDSFAKEHEGAKILTAKLRLQLLLEKDDRSQYTCIPIGKVLEIHDDGTVVLDANYIVPCLNCAVSPKLHGYIREVYGMLRFRGEELARRVAHPSAQVTGAIQDFLLLQLMNRHELKMDYFGKKKKLLPEILYEEFITLAGELATFSHPDKRLPTIAAYRHDDLQHVFGELMATLRQSLAMILDKGVVPLKIQESKQGIKVALITDRSLFDNSDWIVAVKASMNTDALRSRFVAQAKIAPIEKIRDLVGSQLPGIKLESLPVAPPELPYHSGFLYFRLDKNNPLFQHMKESAGFAFYVSADITDIELECWAIRR
jgi:type VI secretion system protein ImpJ